jgi:hypothetical protein
LPVEEHCHGFVPGRSIVTNARVHVGQAVVVNLDWKGSFLPSRCRESEGCWSTAATRRPSPRCWLCCVRSARVRR